MERTIRAKLVLQLRPEHLSVGVTSAAHGMTRKGFSAVLEAPGRAEVGGAASQTSRGGEVYVPLFPGRGEPQSVFGQPDWGRVHVGVTLMLMLLHPGLGLVNAAP